MYLAGVHPVSVHLIGVHVMGVPLIGVSLMAYLAFTSLPCVQDMDDENPCIDTNDIYCWSPLERAPRGESCRKDCPTASVLLEAKAAALHPERYQSSLPKLSTNERGRNGEKKRRQSDWLANQIYGKVMGRQVIRRTG
jgi:hypothetical protein